MTTPNAWIRRESSSESVAGGSRYRAGGEWTAHTAAELEKQLQTLPASTEHVDLDLSAIDRIDTTGVLLLHRWLRRLDAEHRTVRLLNASDTFQALDELVRQYAGEAASAAPARLPLLAWLQHVGELTVGLFTTVTLYLNFIGAVLVTLAGNLLRPARFRFTLCVNQMQIAGYNAIPIIALISFLIGIVVAYQGALQLGKIGAKMLTIDLIAVSILRELGVLLTAIVVAGRSASTFAAEIGSMKLQEEIKAMQTMGIDVYEVLVVPRVAAMLVVLPILTFIADILGLAGGAIMCLHSLDIPLDFYIGHLTYAVSEWTFWIGIIKAPFFAAIIAIVGCYEGLQVSNSAESLGHHTTRSVVISIFLIIVVDAVFSVVFGLLGI